MKRRYLFTLEITPIEAGKTYEDLPSHLTLISRFFFELSPEHLFKVVRPMFERARPIEPVFGKTTELGPKKLIVQMVKYSDELKKLHNGLRDLLDSIKVDYDNLLAQGTNLIRYIFG